MQKKKQKISSAVIRRLPRYYRYLHTLIEEGVDRISSAELSRRMNVTASQIRQDLNHFGGFGQQGYGYNVLYLRKEIGKVLGLDREHSMAVIGVGNLGKALVRSQDFRKKGFFVTALFDCDPEVIGKQYCGCTVRDTDEIISYLKDNPVDIGVLTVPKQNAEKLAGQLIEAGVKAIWNFANVCLQLPHDVIVQREVIAGGFALLSMKRRSHG